MLKTRHTFRHGATLIELVTAMTAATIVMAGLGVLLADSLRGWSSIYDRAYADVVTDGYVAVNRFDNIMRRAVTEGFSIDEDGDWVEIRYYQSEDSTEADRYARLYESDGSLKIKLGQVDPRLELAEQILCSNVSDCTFKQIGLSIQMVLTLDDAARSNRVVCCGYMHN